MNEHLQNSAGVVATVSLTLLAGCSGDGGFFPATVNHNEGAVDYRVARLDPTPLTSQTVSDGYLPLGGADNAPYVPLTDAGVIHAFSRTRTPEYVITAQDNVLRADSVVMSKAEALQARELELRASKERLDKTEKEIDRADARVKSAKAAVDKFDSSASDDSSDLHKLSEADRTKLKQPLLDEFNAASSALVETQKPLDARKADVVSAETSRSAAQTELATAKTSQGEARSALATATNTMNEGVAKGTVDRETVQSVRVTLKQAYLRDFLESGSVGEVAVLMTVKESRTGLGQQEPKSGRVVYYSEGVRKSAFMNFRDQPVYGPVRYGGDDLQIRVSVIELDEKDNEVAGAMLKTIATIGSVAYPPSSPVLAALDQIGASLLTLNGPDLEWDYLMRLSSRPPTTMGDPSQTSLKWIDAWLRDGYYVLMRSDTSTSLDIRKRICQEEWDKLVLDPRTGVIYKKPSPNAPFEQYFDHSYLVFTVQTGFDSSQLDIAQEAAELGTVLAAYSTGSESVNSAAEAMSQSIVDSISKLKGRKRQEQKAKDVR